MAELTINIPGQKPISARLLQARANAQCADGVAFIRADAPIADLQINDQHIAVTGEVNQKVPLPVGGFVIINEQVASVSGGKGDFTVRALHIVVPEVLPGTVALTS